MGKKVFNRYNLIIGIWLIFFISIETVLIINMINKANSDNYYVFFVAMLLSSVFFISGLLINLRLKKKYYIGNTKRLSFFSIIFQIIIIFMTFVGLFEAGLDAQATTTQVKKIIQFIKGEKEEKYLKSLTIEIIDSKEAYEIGDEMYFEIIYTPNNANIKGLYCDISNNIISVDINNKKIKCLKNGETAITFLDSNNKDIKYTLNLKINSIITEDIRISHDVNITLDPNESFQIEAECIPTEAIDRQLFYYSSDNKVAVVNSSGLIQAIGAGDAVITVTNNNISKEIYIHVNDLVIVPVELNLNKEVISFDEEFPPVDDKYSVGTIIKFTSDIDCTYVSSNNSVITINEEGIATCIAAGQAQIIAESKEDANVKKVVQIYVYDKVYSVKLNEGKFESFEYKDGIYYLTVKVNKMYDFEFEDSNINQEYRYENGNNENIKMSENSILITEPGEYTGYIEIGDKESPYKQTVKYKITCIESTITAALKYFVRKLFGHFGYFLVLGIMCTFALVVINCFKTNILLSTIYVILFGMYQAFTTEYIQKTDPTRTCAFSDMVLDYTGYIIGVVVVLLVFGIIKIIKKLMKKLS